ncbi:hypothetical protein PWG71_08535 [Nocardiopsis sp. N85]|uniref:hypothetical protein n=1 Tax=Nocardiopsis sp. N85 TaxID=3029400 RepID=UPI00237EFBAC|nr:hypothetical protein [Nocardiopsis sp. N85]MDE3721434.1 hypothetical protein [Nocardiopsis sp. N85]
MTPPLPGGRSPADLEISDDPLPPPSDDPPPEGPEPEAGPEADPEITDDPLPPPEDPQGGEPPVVEPEPVELEVDDNVFDCDLIDAGCHVSNWFADFAVSGLNPALGWLASKAFYTPVPTEGMQGLHAGILGVSNTLFVLLVVAGGLIAMGHQSVQSRYSAADILPRIVWGFVAANVSLWISTEMITVSNQVSAAIGAQSIDPREAAENFRDRLDALVAEALIFTVLLVVVVVILFVVWMITEAVRICMAIVLVIGAPLLLIFHALPHTNRVAEMWWRSMAGLCAIPVGQSIVFMSLAKLFFEGQLTFADINHTSSATGDEVGDADWLMQLLLLLVLIYTQIRIGSWVMRLVWQPNPGTSPIASLLKNIAWMLAFRSVSGLRMPRALPSLGLHWPRRSPAPPGRPLPRHTPAPPSGLQPLQPQAWWYRARHDPAGALGAGRPALPGPGGPAGPWPAGPGAPPGGGGPGTPGHPGRPRALPGPRALPPPGSQRGLPGVPPRRALEEGRMPGSPQTGQQVLFPRPPAPAVRPQPASPTGAPRRRWRQLVLPTPPPVRVPGRRAPERLGWVGPRPRAAEGLRHLPSMPALSWDKRPQVKGQIPLFSSPRRVWKQYGLFPRPDRDGA